MKTIPMTGRIAAAIVTATLLLTGCAGGSVDNVKTAPPVVSEEGSLPSDQDSVSVGAPVNEAGETFDNNEDGGHAIEIDGDTAEYSKATVTKTGDSEGDEADVYGENSAIFVTNGAHLTLSDMNITTNGTHANAVFSYGEGTVVDISNSTIETSGNCSGGIMTTGGGTMNASNLTIHTTGRSSAAIRSDRGGGTVTVIGGNYTTEGLGSPAIYSTADITVNDASLTSTTSQGVVVEGKNSVTLNNVVLNADNNQHNSDKSDVFEAIMIYQSMSGDAAEGLAKFSATGGQISNANGDVFFVNNTATDITLSKVNITNNGGGAFLRAAAAGWGNEGSNGGKVNLTATSQKIEGDMIVDDISVLNLYLKDGSAFNGAINPEGSAGDVYVEITDGSKWTLTGDSNINSLTCEADSIDLNGYTLMVDGKKYTEGTACSGEAVEIKSEGGGREGMQAPPDGDEPQMGGKDMEPPKDGERPSKPDGEPPEKPDGDPPAKTDGQPPEKPDGMGGPGGGNPPDKPE